MFAGQNRADFAYTDCYADTTTSHMYIQGMQDMPPALIDCITKTPNPRHSPPTLSSLVLVLLTDRVHVGLHLSSNISQLAILPDGLSLLDKGPHTFRHVGSAVHLGVDLRQNAVGGILGVLRLPAAE